MSIEKAIYVCEKCKNQIENKESMDANHIYFSKTCKKTELFLL